MATAKGLSSSVPPQGGSGASKRQADDNHELTNLPGYKGLGTPPPWNHNQQPYNGQGAHSLTYDVTTIAAKGQPPKGIGGRHDAIKEVRAGAKGLQRLPRCCRGGRGQQQDAKGYCGIVKKVEATKSIAVHIDLGR
ncbi:hypothetical protein E2562_012502 [Oryza meyeriana var. granulata]|uniref:Uncharacterized protein n=1 Tax=Oryza meyeriana var. granulata TaxID=110450 RepID=A0A6G1BVM0_9ORYZ|nr:hypothetical protein E2562_012502 [Oryza meyeriana var. granulata]